MGASQSSIARQPPPINDDATRRLSAASSAPSTFAPGTTIGPAADLWKSIVSPLLPGLYLGSREAACNIALLRDLKVQGCVNCTSEPHIHPKHFRYYHVNLDDSPSDANAEAMLQHFDQVAASFVVKFIAPPDRSVLIYCARGVSRSCTIALALLLHLKPSWTLLDAWKHVKRARPSVRPNLGFMRALATYEIRLRGGVSSVRVTKKGFEQVLNPSITPPLKSQREI